MNIRVYIVTYKKNDVLNKNLESLWRATHSPGKIKVVILANHPTDCVYEANRRDNLKVVYNTSRMANAWGYLSRDWNYGILDAFGTWENKKGTDWCVLAQNDILWQEGWDDWLRHNTDFDFISQPRGDQLMAINIDAVKKIGFFDERFTTLHCQEFDYFARAVITLKSRCSINDDHESVNWRYHPVGNVLIKETAYSGIFEDQEEMHNISNCAESISFRGWKWKWGDIRSVDLSNLQSCPSKEVNWYPFFWKGYAPIKSTFLNEYYEPYGGSTREHTVLPDNGYVSWGTKPVTIDEEWTSNDFWTSDYNNLARLTEDMSVLFVDIGANEGQSARKAYRFFKECQVISYEPLTKCNPALDRIKSVHPGYVYHNLALGAEKGTQEIYEYEENTGLSSVLPLASDYSYCGSVSNNTPLPVIRRKVGVLTMQDLYREWQACNKNVNILKIDTQGTELDILKNGRDILSSGYFGAVMIEIMTLNKYTGQGKYTDTLQFLDECGFVIWNIRPIYREFRGKSIDPCGFEVGQDTEYDFLWIHRKLLKKIKGGDHGQ